MCPFCYIGKRKFEQALLQFPAKDEIALIWKSFQLSPDLKTDHSKNIHQFLAAYKNMSLEQATDLNNQLAQLAARVGLVYNFDKVVVANSFNAHRFSHFAKSKGRQSEAEELLFQSYFTDGRDIDDYPTLVELGTRIGLEAEELTGVLQSGQYGDAVRADIREAQQLGVRSIPFFVFDKKYAVSGAQETNTYLQALESAHRDLS